MKSRQPQRCESEIKNFCPCPNKPTQYHFIEWLGPVHLCDSCYTTYNDEGYTVNEKCEPAFRARANNTPFTYWR